MAAAEANLSNARLQLSYTILRGPVSGWITRKDVQMGSYLQVGQSICSIVPAKVFAMANFKETQLQHIHVGDKVDLRVDAFSGRTWHGTVDSIQAGSGARFSLLPPENATGNYVKVVQRVPVKIDFDAGEDLSGLAPGMSVEPKVWLGTGK